MDVTEFKRLLENGLGRAILFLQQHDSTPYRDVILDACLHNLGYDRQIEGSRATYMLDVIRATGQEAHYRTRLLAAFKALTRDADEYDVDQLTDIVGHWAAQNDTDARLYLYQSFLKHIANERFAFAAGMNIIAIDGMRGFNFVATGLGELVLTDSNYVAEPSFYNAIKDRIGENAVDLKLQQSDNPRVAAYVKSALEVQQQRRSSRRPHPDPSQLSYQQVKELIAQPSMSAVWLSWWGEQAAETDLLQAANDLVAETDAQTLWRCMRIFVDTPFPLDPGLLFPLVYHEDELIARSVFAVLKNIQQPSVRTFALKMIAQSYQTGLMVSLLAKNYQDGDWQLITQLLERDLDRVDLHDLGFSVRDVYKLHPSADAIPVFITLYDKDPCANCRRDIVEQLVALNAVPEWMIEECRYDSNSDIRELFEPPTVTQ